MERAPKQPGVPARDQTLGFGMLSDLLANAVSGPLPVLNTADAMRMVIPARMTRFHGLSKHWL